MQRYKDFKEEKEFNQGYGDKAIAKHIRSKEYKNKLAGKAPYEDFSTSDIIVAEDMKDKAKARLKALQTTQKLDPEIKEISEKITDLETISRDAELTNLRKKFEEVFKKPIDEDTYKGIGSFDPHWKK